MNAFPHDPNGSTHRSDLSGSLGRAVGAVRSEPVPQDALARALQRAQQLQGVRPTRRAGLDHSLLALGALAATLLIALFLVDQPAPMSAERKPKEQTLAQLTEALSEQENLRTWSEAGMDVEKLAKEREHLPFAYLRDGGDRDQDGIRGESRATEGRPAESYFRLQYGRNDPDVGYRLVTKADGTTERVHYTVCKKLASTTTVDALRRANQLEEQLRSIDPQDEIRAGNASGPGSVDLKRAKDLADNWGTLPEKDRVKALEELTKEMPVRQRDVVQNYFAELGRGAGREGDKDPSKPSEVFHLETRSPTVARVYVGNGNSLDLVSLQVTVTVEGARARTLVDHVFYNKNERQLEGTFEYPLPAGASPSYFAMFLGQSRDAAPPRFTRRGNVPELTAEAVASLAPVEVVQHVSTEDWGKLQEARIVPKQKAVEAYEEVVRGRIDPALLEYAGGNTFRGRVFPIAAKGYNRVVLAYEELLPTAGDKTFYRFPLPNSRLGELDFFLQADRADCKEASFLPKEAVRQDGEHRLAFHRSWKDESPTGDVRFIFTPARPDVQAISGRQGNSGPQYLYARIRPEFEKVERAKAFADHAVFLLDTSLSEHPDRFALNVKLLRQVLEGDADIKQFNILTFNVGSAWLEPKGWLPNTPAGRAAALARLDGLVLEGATDLSSALDSLSNPGFDVARGTPLNIFLLSDGNLTWGETETSTLVARFEAHSPFAARFYCYRTGLGAENLELFAALTRKGGGVFNCFTEADQAAAAKAHRSQCLQVEHVSLEGGPAASDILIAGRKAAIYPGGELIVAARLQDTGKTKIVLEGTYLGEKVRWEYPVEVTGTSELAPRGWGEVAVASLLGLNDPRHDDLVTAYCQEFGIASRTASFLVLETENDYKRFKLDEERGKTVPGDLGRFLDEAWKGFGKVLTARKGVERFLAEVDPRVHLYDGKEGAHVKKLLALLGDKDCELPAAALDGALLHKNDLPAEYLTARDQDLRAPSTYLLEAQRRLRGGDTAGAVRVLSSVIEENPGRDDALRYVGYRLLDLKQGAHAVRLFDQVQRQRPFEPHSYRDLARSLEETGKYGLAALQYEIVLAGTWHARFHESLKEVAAEEYVHMMRQAIQEKAVSKELADQFGERLEGMTTKTASDLRVTISWNTDNTDVDLWVIEPDGTKCFYEHNRTAAGGELSQDQTQGYGPERYRIAKARPGEYTVVVHYYRANVNLLASETHVNVVIARHAGTPQETTERRTVILHTDKEAVEVCKVKF